MKRHKGTLQTTLFCKKLDRDVDIEIEYSYIPGYPGTWETPPDSPEVEILSVVPVSEEPDEQDIEIDDFDMEQLMEEAFEHAESGD